MDSHILCWKLCAFGVLSSYPKKGSGLLCTGHKIKATVAWEYLQMPEVEHFWHNSSGLIRNNFGALSLCVFYSRDGKRGNYIVNASSQKHSFNPSCALSSFHIQTLRSVCFLQEIVSWLNTPYRHVLSPAIGFTGSYLYSASLCLLSDDAKSVISFLCH